MNLVSSIGLLLPVLGLGCRKSARGLLLPLVGIVSPSGTHRKPARKPTWEALECRQVMSGPQMVANPSVYDGLAIVRAQHYDLQPSVLSDPGDAHFVKGKAAPEITVDGITDGQSTAINFGVVAKGAAAPTRTFTVHNDGSATLTLGSLTVPAGYSVVKSLPTSLSPRQSSTFTIRLNTFSPGIFSGQVSLLNNDSDENPFNFPVLGQVLAPAPEIAVSLNGATLTGTSAGLKIGTAYVNQTSPQATLSIENQGGSELVLGNWSVPAGFKLASAAPTRVAPGASVNVRIGLDVASAGIKSGTLRFTTNDGDEASFTINLLGKVYLPVQIVFGSPSPTDHGAYTIYAQAGTSISIDPANGMMPFGGRYVITITGPSGLTSRTPIDGTLTHVVIKGTKQVRVDNWTDIPVQYA
jgi:hypothetical protein